MSKGGPIIYFFIGKLYYLKLIFSGFVAERMDLRYFLSIGMLFSGIFVFLLGFAKVAGIHKIAYFIGMQVRSLNKHIM